MNDDELKKANKGEWSELYAFLKIVHDRHVSAADSKLNPVPLKTYTFTKLFREETKGLQYTYDLSIPGLVKIFRDNVLIKSVDTTEIHNKIDEFLHEMQSASATFNLACIKPTMDELLITKIKADSNSKADLVAMVDDSKNLDSEKLGFSIKSYIGSTATLVNSSSHTNFIYEITGLDPNLDCEVINNYELSGKKVRDRILAVRQAGGAFKFNSISSNSFNSNLRLADSQFPELLAFMLLEFYSGNGNSLIDAASFASQNDEIGASLEEIVFKTKNFLRSAALGMVPSKPWDTRLNTYGGYLVVTTKGDLLCYSLYKDDDFRDYLFNSTKFDTPSTTKHDFGKVYKKNGRYFINLNLQIRFR